MKDIYMLKRLDQVKALTDPLRVKLLDHFSRQALTTKQVASIINEPPHKLYHHVESLEQAGLIVLERTQQNRGTIEKYYKSVAAHFTLSPNLFEVHLDDEDGHTSENTFSGVLQNTLTDVKGSLKEGILKEGEPFFTHLELQLNESEWKILHQKLQLWIDEARNTSQSTPMAKSYSALVAFFPKKQV